MTSTTALRWILVLFVLLLAMMSGALYLESLEQARGWPEFAHLRVPLYVAMVAGLVPTLVAVGVVYQLLGVVDRGEAFSPRTVTLLRRLWLLFGVTSAYLVLGLVGFRLAFGQLHPGIVLGWFAAQVVVLFLVALAGLLSRLFAAAVELRQENELTV